MREIEKIYSDIDLSFKIHPISRDINTLYNEEAVKRALKHIIMLDKRNPFHPERNISIRDLLFEPNTLVTRERIEKRIKLIVEQYMPRIELINILVESTKPDSFSVDITFRIKNILKEITTTLYLQRVR